MTGLVTAGGGELHFQLVVHVPGVRDPIRDFTDETFFLGAVDRPAQDDPAINGGDLHVPGIPGHSAVSNDFLANLRRGVRAGLAVALIGRGQRAAVAITNYLPGIVSFGRRDGVEPGHNIVRVINPGGVIGLAEIGPLTGLEVR